MFALFRLKCLICESFFYSSGLVFKASLLDLHMQYPFKHYRKWCSHRILLFSEFNFVNQRSCLFLIYLGLCTSAWSFMHSAGARRFLVGTHTVR